MWYSTEHDSNNLDFSKPIVAVDEHSAKVDALLVKADNLFFWMDIDTGSTSNPAHRTRESALGNLAPHMLPMNAVKLGVIFK